MTVFNFMCFGLGFLRMGTIGLVAQIYSTGWDTAIAHPVMRGVSAALGHGGGIWAC